MQEMPGTSYELYKEAGNVVVTGTEYVTQHLDWVTTVSVSANKKDIYVQQGGHRHADPAEANWSPWDQGSIDEISLNSLHLASRTLRKAARQIKKQAE